MNGKFKRKRPRNVTHRRRNRAGKKMFMGSWSRHCHKHGKLEVQSKNEFEQEKQQEVRV